MEFRLAGLVSSSKTDETSPQRAARIATMRNQTYNWIFSLQIIEKFNSY